MGKVEEMKCKICGARKKYEDHNGVEVFECLTPVDYSYQSEHCKIRRAADHAVKCFNVSVNGIKTSARP